MCRLRHPLARIRLREHATDTFSRAPAQHPCTTPLVHTGRTRQLQYAATRVMVRVAWRVVRGAIVTGKFFPTDSKKYLSTGVRERSSLLAPAENEPTPVAMFFG